MAAYIHRNRQARHMGGHCLYIHAQGRGKAAEALRPYAQGFISRSISASRAA